MKNKKGWLASDVILIVLILILLAFVYVIYTNFHTTCIFNNLKSLSNYTMINCRR